MKNNSTSKKRSNSCALFLSKKAMNHRDLLFQEMERDDHNTPFEFFRFWISALNIHVSEHIVFEYLTFQLVLLHFFN